MSPGLGINMECVGVGVKKTQDPQPGVSTWILHYGIRRDFNQNSALSPSQERRCPWQVMDRPCLSWAQQHLALSGQGLVLVLPSLRNDPFQFSFSLSMSPFWRRRLRLLTLRTLQIIFLKHEAGPYLRSKLFWPQWDLAVRESQNNNRSVYLGLPSLQGSPNTW
jgi:hypothetical protein